MVMLIADVFRAGRAGVTYIWFLADTVLRTKSARRIMFQHTDRLSKWLADVVPHNGGRFIGLASRTRLTQE